MWPSQNIWTLIPKPNQLPKLHNLFFFGNCEIASQDGEQLFLFFFAFFFLSFTNIGSGGVEEGVKYYRGQITMTVTSSALTTAAPQHTEVSNDKIPPKIR